MEQCAANQVESALDGIWEILAMHPWDLIYLSIPMSIVAVYVLSIYGAFKYIQRRFSCRLLIWATKLCNKPGVPMENGICGSCRAARSGRAAGSGPCPSPQRSSPHIYSETSLSCDPAASQRRQAPLQP